MNKLHQYKIYLNDKKLGGQGIVDICETIYKTYNTRNANYITVYNIILSNSC